VAGPSLEMLRQTLAANAVVSPVGVEVAATQQGSYRGQIVTRSDLGSKLANASRTQTLGMKTRDLHSVHLRMLRRGQGTNLEATARIADFYEKLPNMPGRAALQLLVEEMTGIMVAARAKVEARREKSADGDEESEASESDREEATEKGAILAALHSFDPDVSHQYAALEIAREHFQENGDDPEFLEELDQAAQEFERADIARDVRAGFASAEAAKRLAATLETDPASVRDAYRTMLREEKNIGQLFDALTKFDMLKHSDVILEAFTTAAGRDLASTNSSTDPRFLHALLTELGKLKQIKAVLNMSCQIVDETGRTLPEPLRGALEPIRVASCMLNFVAKPVVNLTDARALVAGAESIGVAGQVVLVNGLQNMHGAVPDDMIPSNEARQQQRLTLRSLSSRLVEAEEREFEGSTAARA